MKAIIVDDERLARNELKRLLENFPTIEVIAEASNTEEAGPLVEELKPDVLCLDIQIKADSYSICTAIVLLFLA